MYYENKWQLSGTQDIVDESDYGQVYKMMSRNKSIFTSTCVVFCYRNNKLRGCINWGWEDDQHRCCRRSTHPLSEINIARIGEQCEAGKVQWHEVTRTCKSVNMAGLQEGTEE